MGCGHLGPLEQIESGSALSKPDSSGLLVRPRRRRWQNRSGEINQPKTVIGEGGGHIWGGRQPARQQLSAAGDRIRGTFKGCSVPPGLATQLNAVALRRVRVR